jgi:hypothetical protein
MPFPVVTTATGGLPVVEVAIALGFPVIEAANGRGLRVTKVVTFGLPVTFVGGTVIPSGPLVSPANMTSNTAPAPFVASALSTFAGYAPFNPFAALGAGEANSWVSGTGTLPQWIQIDLGSAVAVANYSIRTRNAPPPHEWTAWTLSGSPDGTAWTVADTRTSGAVGANVLRYFPLTPQRTFRYWRWDITATSSNQYADCGQLALYGP